MPISMLKMSKMLPLILKKPHQQRIRLSARKPFLTWDCCMKNWGEAAKSQQTLQEILNNHPNSIYFDMVEEELTALKK